MRQMDVKTWALIFGACALLITITAVILLRIMNKRDLAAEPGPSDDATKLVVKGKTYGLHTLKNVRGPSHWVLSLPVVCPHTFSVHREDMMLAWLQSHLGDMTRVLTGTEHYDQEFKIDSKEPDWASKFFHDEENRRIVQELFGFDCSAVILSKGRIQVCFEERDALEGGAEALSELAARLNG